jgi:di/tricarboxylate transporter
MDVVVNNTVLWCCLAAIVISVVVSYKWKMHMGVIAMAFAFLIGCLIQKTSVTTIFGYWPGSIIFFFIASSLLFGFAEDNGTMVAFGDKLLWIFRGNTKIVPWVLFFIGALVTFLGAGTSTVFFLTPISFAIGLRIGMNPMMTVVLVNLGYVCGAYNPWTGIGVVMQGFVEAGAGAEHASGIYIRVYATFLIKNLLFMTIFYTIFEVLKKKTDIKIQANKPNEFIIEKPKPFTDVQRKTFTLIVLSFLLIVVPSVIHTLKLDQGNEFLTRLALLAQPQSVCVIFAVIASAMKLGDRKKVMARVPISTILLVAGVTFLMQVAVKSGLLKVVAGWFSGDIALFLIPPALCLIAGFLSIFSSATSVVIPMMFPLVPALVAGTGLNPVNLYTSIMVGAGATAVSPFSTSGGQTLALAPDELKGEALAGNLFILAVSFLSLAALFAAVGLFNILKY